ncbi:formimidoylglutamase [Fusobacterium ulcerans]|uniref:Formimidoylglutamase n=1 Tax=Fusobacterium ulcerans TaxID=861 RepID=A0AAX2J9V2_9FUSO|nr:formimidoylglutamase [Fusobacterium ulcerans]AVQ28737.1 formimidoylglutamase [Fusobacterium ulcerans]EFS26213.1 formimidoylglutamase [Fusobacterium ulcerans ATCC 49185]SQJ00632.1 Formimidoylglutamase [Fusobacterium ulcerans]
MKDLWHGRFDSNEDIDLRIWQIVKPFDDVSKEYGICFVGYDTDDGIKRNQGRIGAEKGSNAIRKAIQSFPIVENLKIYDYQNLKNKVLEEAQKEYSLKISNVIKKGIFPIGLGGGHDIAFASYSGIRKAYPDKKIGIVNFDTHLDMRPYDNGATSGTSFKQILDEDKNVKYSIVGFKKQGNTKRLIDTAKNYNVLILDEEDDEKFINDELKKYLADADILYVTFCMDVFNASDAPGVSAPTIMGLDPKKGKRILREIMNTGKVVCIDFAEVSPEYDIDSRTAKLAGSLIYDIMNNLTK